MSLRDVFVSLAVFISIPFILKRPEVGVYMWAWLGYMNPHKLSWGFAYNFPFAQLVAITTFISLIISKRKIKIPWTGEIFIVFLFAVWVTITSITSMYPELAWQQWNKFIKILIMTFLSLIIIERREQIQTWLWVIALSLGFYGFKGGLFTLLTGGGYHVYGPEGTFIGGNNEIGLALIMVMPLLRYCQLMTKEIWIKRSLMIGMVLCLLAILGTQSRGAFLGVGAMTLFLVKNSRHKWTLIIGAIIVFPIVYLFMPESWHERMFSIVDYEHDGSAMGRINAWKMAYNLAVFKLLGGGFECFQEATFAMYAPDPLNIHDAHSIYFEVLGEHGFVGLILFLSLGYSAWRSCIWIMKRTKENSGLRWIYDLAAMLQVSIVGYAVSGAFLGLAYFDLYYNLIALIIILKNVTKRALIDKLIIEENKELSINTSA